MARKMLSEILSRPVIGGSRLSGFSPYSHSKGMAIDVEFEIVFFEAESRCLILQALRARQPRPISTKGVTA